METPLLPHAHRFCSRFSRWTALPPPIHMNILALYLLLRRHLDFLVLEFFLDIHVLIMLVMAERAHRLTRIEIAQSCSRDDLWIP